MNAKSGHIKDTTQDDNGFRQFIINCFGSNDQRKYFSIAPFGIDFNVPENTRSLTAESANKDIQYNLGVLNKIKIDALSPGECVIFSTDDTGEDLVSGIVLRNTGDIETNKDISGNATVNIKADGTIELNGNADKLVGFTELKAGFDELVSDYNNALAELNKIITALNSWVPIAQDGGAALKTIITGNPPTNVSDSTASIDDSEKSNLKTE